MKDTVDFSVRTLTKIAYAQENCDKQLNITLLLINKVYETKKMYLST